MSMNEKLKNAYDTTVTISCETKQQAQQIINERIQYDEDYGFPYTISASEPKLCNAEAKPTGEAELTLNPYQYIIDAESILDEINADPARYGIDDDDADNITEEQIHNVLIQQLDGEWFNSMIDSIVATIIDDVIEAGKDEKVRCIYINKKKDPLTVFSQRVFLLLNLRAQCC